MPFDHTTPRPRPVIDDSLWVLAQMRELFGPDGARWTKDRFSIYADHEYHFCLVGALRKSISQLTHDENRRRAIHLYLFARLLTCSHVSPFDGDIFGLTHWNDHPERTWTDIREVLDLAESLTHADAQKVP